MKWSNVILRIVLILIFIIVLMMCSKQSQGAIQSIDTYELNTTYWEHVRSKIVKRYVFKIFLKNDAVAESVHITNRSNTTEADLNVLDAALKDEYVWNSITTICNYRKYDGECEFVVDKYSDNTFEVMAVAFIPLID